MSTKPYPGMGQYVLILMYGAPVADRGSNTLSFLIQHARRLPAGWDGRCYIIDQTSLDPHNNPVWSR